mgnify:FL=1
MKQIIPFVKDINLNSNIFEITSIALEHNLKMENNDSIVGVFTVSGKYKINEISLNEESFENNINFDITLDDKYDASKVKIDIDDFYYEIVDDVYLRVHIDVLVDNLVYAKKPLPEEKKEEKVNIEDVIPSIKKLDERSSSTNNIEEEVIDIKEDVKDIDNEKTEERDENFNKEEIVNNFSSSFLSEENSFATYKVHIVRESETIDTIIEKYNTTKEELEKYNSLDNIILGSKIIVPVSNE